MRKEWSSIYFNKFRIEQIGRGYVVDGVKEDNSYYILLSDLGSNTILRMEMCNEVPMIAWEKKISYEFPINLILLKDKVIFDNCDHSQDILEVVDKEKGERLWCYPGGQGMLAAGNEKFIYLSPFGTNEIHILQASDGVLQQKIKAEGVEEDRKTRIKKIFVYNGECYCVFSSKKGLILTHIHEDEGVFSWKIIQILSNTRNIKHIKENRNWLICVSDSGEGYYEYLAINVETMQIEAQMKLPEEWYKEVKIWRPASKDNPFEQLIVFEKSYGGVAYVDLKTQEIRWYHGGKGRWDVNDACFSQGRVMAIASGENISEVKEGEPKFVEIDPISGEWNYVSEAGLYFLYGFEDLLVTDSVYGFNIFRWSEDEVQEANISNVSEDKTTKVSEESDSSINQEILSQVVPKSGVTADETVVGTAEETVVVTTEVSWSAKLEKYIKENNLVELEKLYIQGTGITKFSSQVVKYLKRIATGENIKGPIYFEKIQELFRLAPKDESWLGKDSDAEAVPILFLASEMFGNYFYLMPESGMVLCMHHDDERSRISEIAERFQINGKLDVAGFCKKMETSYGLCRLDQLLKLQSSLENYTNFMDIPQPYLIRRTSEAFKDSLAKLKKAVNYIAYQCLSLEEEVINSLMLLENNMNQAKENPLEVRSFFASYLEGTTLNEEILACKQLVELDLSFNPQLDYQRVFEQLQQFPYLKRLVLKGNQLETIPDELVKLINLKELILSNNQLDHPSHLKLLNTLRFIDLRNNPVVEGETEKLRSLLPDTRIAMDGDGWVSQYPEWKEPYSELEWIRFLPVNHLEELEALRMTDVRKIEPEISKCKKLKYLEFRCEREKELLEFSDSIAACENIETLILRSQSRITFEDIIPKLKPLKKLKRLVLDPLPGKTFPKELLELTWLEELEITFTDSNFISYEKIEGDYRMKKDEAGYEAFYKQCYEILSQSKQLRKLILRRPSKSIPKDFGKELQLEELVLDFHQSELSDWSTVFHAISNVKTLKRLEVISSKCSEIPLVFGQLKNLEYLNLSCNYEIADWNKAFEVISGLTGLRYLNLYRSEFSYFPDCMKSLVNLTEFRVDAKANLNSLFQVCAEYPKLEYLSFDQQYFHGQVHVPENIGELKALKVLSFYRNPAIKSFPKTMSKLINLEKLNARLCGITKEHQQELIGMLPYCQVLVGDNF